MTALRRWTPAALKAALLALIVFFVVRDIPLKLSDIGSFLARADYRFYASLLLFAIFLMLQAGIWVQIVGAAASGIPGGNGSRAAKLRPLKGLRIFIDSQFAKYIPGGFWNYAGRIVLATREGVPMEAQIAAIVYENVLLLAAALLYAFMLLLVLGAVPYAAIAAAVALLALAYAVYPFASSRIREGFVRMSRWRALRRLAAIVARPLGGDGPAGGAGTREEAASATEAASNALFAPDPGTGPGFAPASGTGPGSAPASGTEPGFAPASGTGPGFAPASITEPGFAPASGTGSGFAPASSIGFGSAPVAMSASGAALSRNRFFGYLACFLASHLVMGFAFWLLTNSFGHGHIGVLYAAGTFATSWLLGLLSPLPGGLGVREGFLVYFLSLKLGADAALSISVIARLWNIMAEVLFWLIVHAIDYVPIRVKSDES